MAAPYAAAPQTTPAAMPTDEGRTCISLPMPPPMGAPGSIYPEADDEGAPAAPLVAEEPPSSP